MRFIESTMLGDVFFSQRNTSLLGALVLAFALGGCDGSGETTTETTSTTSTGASGGGGSGGSTGGMGGAGGMAGSGGGGSMEIEPDWSCIGSVTYPTPAGATAVMTPTYKDFLTDAPLEAITINACAKDDIDCATPLDTQTTDAQGMASVTVPLGATGFDGFLELSSPELAWLAFTTKPVTSDLAFESGLVKKSGLNALAALSNATLDPERGVLVLNVEDCGKGGRSGVIFEVSTLGAGDKITYVKDGLPNKNAVETDGGGLAVVINAPIGPTTVTSKVKADGKTIATHEVFVRNDSTITSIFMTPAP